MEEVARESIKLARQLSTSGYYSKSFDLYLSTFEKHADLKTQYETEFRDVFIRFNNILTDGNKITEIFLNFGRALEAFPDNIYLLNDIGSYLYKYAFYEEAWHKFQYALSLEPGFVDAEKNLNSIKNLLVERWHFRMLNDKIRNDAYHKAITKTIDSQDSILDIGTGTGLLSLYALSCSPTFVAACDGSETMTELATYISRENKMEPILIIHSLSTSLTPKNIGGKKSLVLTELFDAGLFGEHILQTLSHAWEHLISDQGRVIPNKAEFFVVCAKSDHLIQQYQLSKPGLAVLNIPNLHVHISTDDETYDCNDIHLIKDIKYMSNLQSLVEVNFNDPADIHKKLTNTEPYSVDFKAVDNGEFNLIIGWFNLYLTDEITITTNPQADYRADAWQHAIFFDNIPKIVKRDQPITLDFLINNGKLTLLHESTDEIIRVSPEVIRFLNDSDYVEMITGCIPTVCIYLGQIVEMSQVCVVDLSPFPLLGMLLLKRGAKSLVCCAKTDNDKKFINTVFVANQIDLSLACILNGQDWTQDVFKDEKYHAIFCNMFEIIGDFDLRLKEIGVYLKQECLHQGGLFMPAKIDVIAQVVDSNWLDINNRLYDENVHKYKMAKFINKYQVTQNFGLDFTQLEYIALSEPIVIGSYDSVQKYEVCRIPIVKNGCANAILVWYNIELLQDICEISTNRENSYIDGIAFILNPKIQMYNGEHANILRCISLDGAFKLMIESL